MRVLTLVALLVAPTLQPSDAPIDPLIDEPAIDFEAATLDGGAVRLSDLSGQVVLVNFWGIWCTSCRQEIPELVELDRELRDRGLVVLGADYGDQPEAIPAFAERFGMTYPILLDDALAETYEVGGFSDARHRPCGAAPVPGRRVSSGGVCRHAGCPRGATRRSVSPC